MKNYTKQLIVLIIITVILLLNYCMNNFKKFFKMGENYLISFYQNLKSHNWIYKTKNHIKRDENKILFNYNLKFKSKILITYVYYENNFSKKNLQFFIKNGLYQYQNIIYNIIIKGDKCSIKIPKLPNLFVYKTENEGRDFTGYADSLLKVNIEEFNYFIFLNDTIRGPFLPRFLSKKSWPYLFLSLLNEKTKLIGSTINYFDLGKNNKNTKHVQSMNFATDLIGIKILLDNGIFNKNKHKIYLKDSIQKYISELEVGMTKVILEKNYNIDCFQQKYNSIVTTENDNIQNDGFSFTSLLSEPVHPLEIMFIKSKNHEDKITEKYSNWNLD